MPILDVPLDQLRRRTSLKWRHYGPEVLPLWVAEMDTATLPAVRDAVGAALELGDTGYPTGTAYPAAFADFAQARWGWRPDPEASMRRAPDVMGGIRELLELLTMPGDAVVINPPVYAPFRFVVTDYGRRLAPAALTASGRLDLDALEREFAAGAKAYLLCSPHNPTGTVHTRAELAAVAELAAHHGVAVIVDEIHAALVRPGVDFVPYLTLPGTQAAWVVTSAGKTFNLAGFKAGLFIAGADALPWARLPGLATTSTGQIGSIAHAAALNHGRAWLDELLVELEANKRLLTALLAQYLPGSGYLEPEGTYLAWIDCTRLGLASPAKAFLDAGVALSAGHVFAPECAQFVRVNLATAPAILTAAVERMGSAARSTR